MPGRASEARRAGPRPASLQRVLAPAALILFIHTPRAALQWSLGLPWADTGAGVPGAVFDNDRLVAFTGLDGERWELTGAAVAGPDAGRVLWTAEFPLGTTLPSPVAAAGELAVIELDGQVYAVHPDNGTIAWNTTSPCSLGDPKLVTARCVGAVGMRGGRLREGSGQALPPPAPRGARLSPRPPAHHVQGGL